MKYVALTSGLLSSLLLVAPLRSGEPAREAENQEPPAGQTKVQRLMQRKRELSHQVFDAIIAKDFKRIGQDAKALVELSQVAEWRVYQTPRYLQYSTEFQEAAGKLADNARDKNSDGTTLAFTQMTFSCVRCHDYIRQTRSTQLEPKSGESLARRVAGRD
jgi:hypothetical protein